MTSKATTGLDYSSGKTLLANGSEALHEHYAEHVERAMGRALPQMEVRFSHLSLATQVAAPTNGNNQQLPTIGNVLKSGLHGLVSRKKQTMTKHILHDVSGVFKPGTMTLILGQPGSGKSSLLKMLSGRFPLTKEIAMEGEVTYNGMARTDTEMSKRLPQFVTYVTQRDTHFPTLSVKETLEFAHECCGGELTEREERHFNQGAPEENQAALNAVRALYRHYPEVVIQQLGLENCQDTVVGDAMLRGVSGGERKRVTTGEMEFGNRNVLLMDEISTGLDSAATFDIIKTYRSMARHLRKTVVIALLQPSPEVFGLFDDVLLLNKGRVMYNGPRDGVLEYFGGLGLVCPVGRDVADFLVDLGTDRQDQYRVGRVGDGGDGINSATTGVAVMTSPPRSASEFAFTFESSVVYQNLMKELNAPHDPVLLSDIEYHFNSMPEFHQSFWASTWTLMKRELKVTVRNDALIKGRAVMIIVIGLLYVTLFYQFDPSNVQVVMGTVYGAMLFLALGYGSQLPLYLQAREIFYKQRDANFFRTTSYVFSRSASLIPAALIESIIFGSMVYWICGFVSSAEAFLVFELLIFVTMLAFAAWFFFLSSIAPNLYIADPLGTVSLLCYILFSGFLMTKDIIPEYFIWIYWFSPISWCLRSLAINQYGASEFDVCEYDGVDYCKLYGKKMGDYTLSIYQIDNDRAWLWYGVIYLVASYLFFMLLSVVVLENVRYDGPENVTFHQEIDSEKSVSTLSRIGEAGESEYGLVESPRQQLSSQVAVNVAARRVEPVTLAFKDLWYSVPDPKDPKGEPLNLLKGISGFATPGTITALMGSSGAGKTTLMDVIAGRKTGGKIEGQILLNGHPATDLAIRRATGYCEQMDIHSEASTFREALTFSAFLRQGSDIPDSQKYDSVEEVLDLLGLRPIADKIIRGSSVEQMKRLTIGVELAAQPSVLFLDEPTSGLDARSAKIIMDGVRKVADTGRTVVCTIHQPSLEVFNVFDSLLLLKRGGQTVYFGELGEKAVELVKYFESIDGVSSLEDGYNPATWMLEVIGAGVGNTANADTDFVSLFEASEKKALLDENLVRPGVCSPAPGMSALEFTSKRAASNWTQARFLFKRFVDLYWRTPDYNLTRVVISTILGLLFGLSFLNMNFETFQGINAGLGGVFNATTFISLVAFQGIMPVAVGERAAFYRERASQTYNSLWFSLSIILVEIPYVLFTSLVFCAIFFPMAGFTGGSTFVLYWIYTFLHVLSQAYIGLFLSVALPSLELAMIVGIIFNTLFFLFMGFIPPAASIPKGYRWLHDAIPIKYSTSLIGSVLFGGDCNDGSSSLGCRQVANLPPIFPANSTIQEYMDLAFAMKLDERTLSVGVVCVYIGGFALLIVLALRFLNHQKR